MIAVLPSMIHPKQPFSDGLGGIFRNFLVEKNILVRNFADFIMKIHHSLTFYT